MRRRYLPQPRRQLALLAQLPLRRRAHRLERLHAAAAAVDRGPRAALDGGAALYLVGQLALLEQVAPVPGVALAC